MRRRRQLLTQSRQDWRLRHGDGHELDARVTFATASQGICLSLPHSRSLRLQSVVVVALAVVTSHNPICSLAAIAFGSPRLVASLSTLQSSYFDHSFSDGPRQDRTGVTCGIKYFEEGRSTHSGLDLYVALTHTHSLFFSLSVGSMCHAPHSKQSINPTSQKVHTGLLFALWLCATGWVGCRTDTRTQTRTQVRVFRVCVEVNSWSIYGQIFSPVIAIILSHISPYILVLRKLLSVSRGLISF